MSMAAAPSSADSTPIRGLSCALLGWIPLVGRIVKTVLGLAVTILMVIGIVNAATGKAKELPFIGGLMHVFE